MNEGWPDFSLAGNGSAASGEKQAGASAQAGGGADASQGPTAGDGAGPGVPKKRKLWRAAGRADLEKLELLPYAAERRAHLLRWTSWRWRSWS
jgi:hypothetical protein